MSSDPGIGAREQWATRVAFFYSGFAMAGWAPLVPLAKARNGLDEGQLGMLLLCLGLGSILVMPFVGGLVSRFGCRKPVLVSALLIALALPVLSIASNVALLAAGLALFGAGLGVMDVSMNIQAVIVERAAGRAMMSGFHGLFSLGGLIGAGAMTGLLSLGGRPLAATLILIILVGLPMVAMARGFLPFGGNDGAQVLAIPRGKVLFIGVLCLIVFLAEGAVLDWSGVFLTENLSVEKARAGLGYVAFAITMALGRLAGDRIVLAIGSKRTLAFGGVCAGAGFGLAAISSLPWMAILGFGLVGLGASNVVPILFSAAGRQRSMPTNLAIASVTTMGYAGILMGPAAIGFVARGLSLPIAFGLIAAGLVAVSLCSRSVMASE